MSRAAKLLRAHRAEAARWGSPYHWAARVAMEKARRVAECIIAAGLE